MKRLSCWVILVLLCAGCSYLDNKPIVTADLQQKAMNVTVYDRKKVGRYQSLGVLKSRVNEGSNGEDYFARTLTELQLKAANIGANGIIIENKEAFIAAYNRISTGTHFTKGVSLDESPLAYRNVILKAEAILIQ